MWEWEGSCLSACQICLNLISRSDWIPPPDQFLIQFSSNKRHTSDIIDGSQFRYFFHLSLSKIILLVHFCLTEGKFLVKTFLSDNQCLFIQRWQAEQKGEKLVFYLIAFIGNSIDPIFNVGEPSEKWTGRRKWAKSIECENNFGENSVKIGKTKNGKVVRL